MPDALTVVLVNAVILAAWWRLERPPRLEAAKVTSIVTGVVALYFLTGWPLWVMPWISLAATLLSNLMIRPACRS